VTDFIDEIREDNIKWYGQCVLQEGGPDWGDVFSEKMYRDRTHFIYELLQNAEDACERRKRLTGEEEFKISFKLTMEHLEVKHNGIDFTDNDIKRVCRVGRKKQEDFFQIGKFGIGFKSVYAYTKTPHIYSGDYAFCIKNLVLPHQEEMSKERKEGETLFFLPFDHEAITPERAYKEIGGRLKNLGLRTLLFLRNISEINWEMEEDSGKYSRSCSFEKGYRWVTLRQNDEIKEKWLVFERVIPGDEMERVIEVAYLVEDIDNGITRIVKAKNTKLVVYFPTERASRLNFLIQGPYNTTASRADIERDEWNENLIILTADLVADSISNIKSIGLLDVNFINILPLRKEQFMEENDEFMPIYEKVKEKLLSEEELIPADENTFVSAKDAVLARVAGLRTLLKTEQIQLLFKKTKWLDGEITEARTPFLREYLMKELEIQEITPERFARTLDESFLEAQTDNWIIEFYKFIHSRSELWREESSWFSEGILRSKPIIRLENDTHIIAFNKDGKIQAYLPSRDLSIRKSIKGYFPTVKEFIVADKDAKSFLIELGLLEPDTIAVILEYILPKYRPWNTEWTADDDKKEIEKISLKNNLKDVRCIIKALKKSSNTQRKEEMISKINETKFLYARNMSDDRKFYCSSKDTIYLPKIYTDDETIEIYFEGNGAIWLLDEIYKGLLDEMFEEISDAIKCLELLGCKHEIYVYTRQKIWKGRVIISSEPWDHRRGLDYFDPDCDIEGLEYALDNISKERARIIWEILKKHYKRIYGEVQSSTNQEYRDAKITKTFSTMGKMLVNSAWLPDNEGNFHKPSEIMLSNLNDDFDKISMEAQYCAEKLQMIKEIEREFIDKLPPTRKKGFQLVSEMYKLMSNEKVHDLLENLVKNLFQITSTENITPDFLEALMKNQIPPQGDESQIDWTCLNPEEERKVREEYGDKVVEIMQKITGETKVEIIKKLSIDSKGLNPKAFLFDQYNGHCQICNTRLDLGPNKQPFFKIFRLVETRNKKLWTNMEFNVLSLCPNCHALLKHGHKDLSNIIEIAHKILDDELAPEPVRGRNGDYYIVKIIMVGQQRNLFFTPIHMNKVTAFLNLKLD